MVPYRCLTSREEGAQRSNKEDGLVGGGGKVKEKGDLSFYIHELIVCGCFCNKVEGNQNDKFA